MKKCGKCRAEKPRSEFYPDVRTRTGLGSYCKPCKREQDRSLGRRDGHKRRGRNLRALYGLTPEDFAEMELEQDGRCLVCGAGFDTARRPVVDHSHITSQVRGLLCGQCNCGLGQFGDSPERLRAAADFLERAR